MTTKCYAMVRGSVARFTLLDTRGKPVQGESSVVVTKGISEVRINEITETQSTDLVRNETDDPRLLMHGREQTLRFQTDINLLGVDPDLLWMLTGQPVVENAAGDVVGNDVVLRLPVRSFAMEVWSKLAQPVDGYTHGYTVFPRMRGGRIGGFGFGGGAVSFSINDARTTRASRWGYGPYSLRWNGGGWDINPWDTDPWDEAASRCAINADPNTSMHQRLGTPVGRNLHWRMFLVDWAPTSSCGAQALYDVVDNGDAAHTSTDVVDGEFVVTSSDIIDGGGA